MYKWGGTLEIDTDRVKQLVFTRGWSEAEFAHKLGVSRSMVNRVFNGKRNCGSKMIKGLLRVFPDAVLDLIIKVTPVENTIEVSFEQSIRLEV